MSTDAHRSRPATLADVARLADVSVAAASRALNGGVRGAESGDPARRKRILAAARDLGYTVSAAAQATKGGRSKSIAVVVNDMDDYGAAAMISGIMHAGESRGVSVTVRSTLDDAEREQHILTQLRGERHRAIVVATSRSTDPERERAAAERLRLLQDDGARVVIIGDNALGFPTVSVDIGDAVAELVRGLRERGFTRFSILAGPQQEVTSQSRVEATLTALAATGIPSDEVMLVRTEFSRDGGHVAARQLLPLIGRVEVVAAMSDAMAVGAMAGLRELGVAAQDRPTFAGFDHVELVADLVEGFSSVQIPFAEFGEAALSLALDDAPAQDEIVVLNARSILSIIA